MRPSRASDEPKVADVLLLDTRHCRDRPTGQDAHDEPISWYVVVITERELGNKPADARDLVGA